ncbi:MAG: bifunctional glutamate N-acetyltransferase/amino-acid acetyltransferase ArgJ [Acidobacteriota bacterium]|nr:bifunctional glutamate N-acetyltransferase/amino-acid acetyltransferase ArgJ [Acidobacteriota bacterium]
MSVSTVGNGELHVPGGFRFASAKAGLKASRNPDLALAIAADGATAAAIFTRNHVVAAPLIVGRKHLAKSRGRVRAVLVNSGNANCATGPAGIRTCNETCRALAKALRVAPHEVFPSSTGIIGVPLPGEKIIATIPEVVAGAAAGVAALCAFAHAIMTTDTRPKIASAQFRIEGKTGKTVTIAGVAKGAGMIHPNMATMLAYIFTDAVAPAASLRRELRTAADISFNCISVDGDTSTNDTVLLLASGASGVRLATAATRRAFAQALLQVCQSLAEQIIADGEGVQHVVRLHIEQARSKTEALQVAQTIATSSLVKTAWAGADPNWGRILAAAGRSGVALDPARIEIRFGTIRVCEEGRAARFDAQAAHQYLSQPSYDVTVRLGRGKASALFLTCDLTSAYVHINADYST